VESDDLNFSFDAFSSREPVPTSLENAMDTLTKAGRGLIAAPMNNAATILIARRRRSSAVWADFCV
jgi:hypothetical protein